MRLPLFILAVCVTTTGCAGGFRVSPYGYVTAQDDQYASPYAYDGYHQAQQYQQNLPPPPPAPRYYGGYDQAQQYQYAPRPLLPPPPAPVYRARAPRSSQDGWRR